MDVTQLDSWDVSGRTLGTGQDVQPLIERVLTHARDSITAGVPHRPASGPAWDDNGVVPTSGHPGLVTPEGIGPELERHKEHAEGGDAASARRVAELYELLDQIDTANTWWRRAAELGDPDAVEYVRVILSR
jgi:hypothetical protein